MTRSILFIPAMFVMFATVALSQTYLISGTPTPRRSDKFGVDLWRLDADGTFAKVSEIVPATSGAWYIDVCSDCRQAVISTISPNSKVIVLGLDQAAVVKTCSRPKLPQDYEGFGQVHEWLSDVPVSGPSYIDYYTGSTASTTRRGALRAMALSASVPCDESFSIIPPIDASNPVTDGESGAEIVSSQEGGSFPAYDQGASQMRNLFDGEWVRIGAPVSRAMVEGLKRPMGGLKVNNSDIFVLDMWEFPHTATSAHQIAVFRKRDQTWKLIPLRFRGTFPLVRSFGPFVALIERSPVDPEKPRQKGSLANKAWRTTPSRLGPGVDRETFLHNTYPGTLHLYNADTTKTLTITTNEPDSEILLVENGRVLYRVNDSLFEAKLEAEGLGPASLLVQSDVIRDSHWAFTKR